MATIQDFLRNNADMIEAARRCLEGRQLLPALVLIYSHIDTLSWVASWPSKVSGQRRFERWTRRWLLPHLLHKSPGLSATDLYAARCAVLHSLTARSKLSESGKARELAYAWGDEPMEALRKAINDSAVAGQIVGVHCPSMIDALDRAVTDFIGASKVDARLGAAVAEAACWHYPHSLSNQGKVQ